MKIGHIELFVNDTNLSKDFFCNILGFELVSDQEEYMWIKLGDTEILLRPGSVAEVQAYQKAPVALVFYAEDLDKTAMMLKNKGLVFKGTDGSDNCLTFTDLEGHWFQLVNPGYQH